MVVQVSGMAVQVSGMVVQVSGIAVQVSGMAFQASVTPFQASSTLKTKNSTPKFILSERPKLGRFLSEIFCPKLKFPKFFVFNVFCVLIELLFLSRISSNRITIAHNFIPLTLLLVMIIIMYSKAHTKRLRTTHAYGLRGLCWFIFCLSPR